MSPLIQQLSGRLPHAVQNINKYRMAIICKQSVFTKAHVRISVLFYKVVNLALFLLVDN